jgi:hypothetical protein
MTAAKSIDDPNFHMADLLNSMVLLTTRPQSAW